MAAKKKASKPKADVLLAAALALKPREVIQLSFDPLQAERAINKALLALKKYRSELLRNYRGFDLSEFDALPEICERIAVQQRIVQKLSGGGVLAQLAPAAHEWRRQLLPVAVGLSVTRLIDPTDVADIERGTGTQDNLRDVLDLVELLTPHRAKVEALYGKDALSKAAQAARAAIDALAGLKGSAEQVAEAAGLRDRYATLLVERYDRLRAAFAAVVSYRDAVSHAGPLADGRSISKKGDALPVAPAP